MMSIPSFIASVLAAGLVASAYAEPLSPARFLPLTSSLVRIEVPRIGGGLAIGTGVTVAPSVIVTNCHVTRDAAAVRISGQGRQWDVDAQFADVEHDVCFLRVPAWPGKPVTIDDSDGLKLSQQVVALGYSGGAAISFRFGHVRALHALDDAKLIESDTAFTSGASGGGLFDTSGALVGLLTFRLRGSATNYFSVPARWIRAKVPAESEWASVEPQRSGIAFWQRDGDALPFFMRVATLDAQGRWAELLDLTDRWSIAAPQDVEPLIVRGRALQKLHRPQAAVVAFHDALRLRPDDAAAWYGLALAYASTGDEPALRSAEEKLATLDKVLAAQLDAKLRPEPGAR
jgi:serine protease Do